jgi:hypothetical protein
MLLMLVQDDHCTDILSLRALALMGKSPARPWNRMSLEKGYIITCPSE